MTNIFQVVTMAEIMMTIIPSSLRDVPIPHGNRGRCPRLISIAASRLLDDSVKEFVPASRCVVELRV